MKKAFTVIEALVALAFIAFVVALIFGGIASCEHVRDNPLRDQNIHLVDQYERNGVHHEIVRIDNGKCYDRYDGVLSPNIEEVPCPN